MPLHREAGNRAERFLAASSFRVIRKLESPLKVHATIAGVALAMTIPSRTRLNALEFSREARAILHQFDRTETGDLLVLTSKGQQESLFALERASEDVTAPILRLEHALLRFSAFVVMPLFAFANAGVEIGGAITHGSVALGVMAGLVLGKPFGILGACLVAVKFGFAKLPDAVNWGSLFGAACLAGIVYVTGRTAGLLHARIAFVLLAGLGTKMLWDARAAAEVEPSDHGFAFVTMLLLALATSIDALAVGVTLPLLGAPVGQACLLIGVVTALMSALGLWAGRRFGSMLGRRIDALGGLLLIALGLKILIEHLNAG